MKNIIILAAGKGTRMKSELPKCACPILGKPMIKYLVDACIDAGIDNIIVVVGYKKEIIKEVLKDYPNISYAFQEEQLGTGHACMVAKKLLSSVNGTTIIVPGDMPLVGKDNLINILSINFKLISIVEYKKIDNEYYKIPPSNNINKAINSYDSDYAFLIFAQIFLK